MSAQDCRSEEERLYQVRVKYYKPKLKPRGACLHYRVLVKAVSTDAARDLGFDAILGGPLFGVDPELCKWAETSSVTLPFHLPDISHHD